MDYFLFTELNSLALKFIWLDTLVVFSAEFLGYWIIALFIFLLWYLPSWRAAWKEIVSVTIIALIFSRGILTELIRALYPRARPFVDYTVNSLLPHEATGSFPSGHAAFYFALALNVFYYDKKWGIVFLVLAILNSVARVIAGVHWPGDILSGFLAAGIAVFLTRFSLKKFNF